MRRLGGGKRLTTARSSMVIDVPTFALPSVESGRFRMDGNEVTLPGVPSKLRIDSILAVNFLGPFHSALDFGNYVIVLLGTPLSGSPG